MKRPELVTVVVLGVKITVLFSLITVLSSFSLMAYALVNTSHQSNAKTPSNVTTANKPNSEQSHFFPKPKAIEKDVEFWKKVYTEISTSEGYIHDNTNLAIIYESFDLSKYKTRKSRDRAIKKVKKKYQDILAVLASGKRKNLTNEQQRVLNLWPEQTSDIEFKKAKKRLRFQLGQSDKFIAGLIRSGSWKKYIIKTLDDMELPREIAALPHVESSFNYKAYSKVGAAGMWQFTRSTGQRYMRIDHVVDERLDPFISSVAAAQLLKNNYEVTGSWPMAITAYNHGAAGMRRAAKKVGSKDIVKILRNYKSRSFGFASRNFYPSFLAAIEIDRQPEYYFPDLQLHSSANYDFLELPAYIRMDTILDVLGIEPIELKNSNPALRASVWNGDKYIPKDYRLRINRKAYTKIKHPQDLLADISPELLFKSQKIDRYHKVRKGQTLSKIAARYKLKTRDLMVANNLRNQNYIRVGQVLILPNKNQNTVSLALDKVKQLDKQESKSKQSEIKLAQANIKQVADKLPLTQSMDVSHNINTEMAVETSLETEVASKQTDSINLDSQLVAQDDETMVETIGDKVLEESKGELLADPSDYSVSEQHSIEIQAAETLGHYAEWLKVRAWDLRRLNKMKYGKHVVVGKRLKLTFKYVTPQEFESQRIAYHKSLQAEFFEQNQIIGADKYRLNRGDSVWELTHRTYKIPFWLLRQYNPDLDMNHITANKIIRFPRVKQRSA